MTPKPMTPFFFGQLADEGIRVILKGAFSHGQLTACEYDGITWKRHPGESAEGFEKRVTQDVRELTGVACRSRNHSEHAAFHRMTLVVENFVKLAG